MAKNDRAATPQNAHLWALWQRLKSYFPAWSLVPSSFYTPGAWGYVGVDFLSGFRRNRSTIQTFDLLEGVDDATFDALSALANLNARRQDQLLRAVVLGYLTVPLSIAALLAEISGESVLAFIAANRMWVSLVVFTATLAPIGYAGSQWRSRQIVSVLDLVRIERGQSPFTALELRDD